MSNKENGMTPRQKWETQLVTKFGKGNVAFIKVKRGAAYFRRPEVEEWEEMQSLRQNPDGTTNRQAYARLVHQCFAGAWVDGEHSTMSLSDIAKLEGPGFIGGPAGAVVNKLAGTGERQATFLGDD